MRGYIFTERERKLILKFLRDRSLKDNSVRTLITRINEYQSQIISDFNLMLKVLATLRALE